MTLLWAGSLGHRMWSYWQAVQRRRGKPADVLHTGADVPLLAGAAGGPALPWPVRAHGPRDARQQRGERGCRRSGAAAAPAPVPRDPDRALLWREGHHEHGRPVRPHRAAPPPASAGALHLICSFPCVILPLYHQGSDLARANPFAAYVFFQNRQAMHAAGSPCHGWCRVAACTVSPAVPSLHAYAKLLGAWQAQTSESANKQMLLCPAQVWVLDALPGSMAEAAGPELRHRKDHPQDLIDRLQVSSSFPCALHSHHWNITPRTSDQAQALKSATSITFIRWARG